MTSCMGVRYVVVSRVFLVVCIVACCLCNTECLFGDTASPTVALLLDEKAASERLNSLNKILFTLPVDKVSTMEVAANGEQYSSMVLAVPAIYSTLNEQQKAELAVDIQNTLALDAHDIYAITNGWATSDAIIDSVSIVTPSEARAVTGTLQVLSAAASVAGMVAAISGSDHQSDAIKLLSFSTTFGSADSPVQSHQLRMVGDKLQKIAVASFLIAELQTTRAQRVALNKLAKEASDAFHEYETNKSDAVLLKAVTAYEEAVTELDQYFNVTAEAMAVRVKSEAEKQSGSSCYTRASLDALKGIAGHMSNDTQAYGRQKVIRVRLKAASENLKKSLTSAVLITPDK